ncbi:MAG: hypothetical protein WBV82_05600 [Myxococcaceae bacterium]
MDFLKSYGVSLNELLLAPIVFRETWPPLRDLPHVTADAMRELAAFGGHSAGAIRTAMSRLRSGGTIEQLPEAGEARYRMGRFGRSVSLAVRGRFERPEGFVLAVFSFAADDVRERQLVRETLKSHGFQKLAQNVYINGQIDTSELERVIGENGLSEHLFLFRCNDDAESSRDERLVRLFNVKQRAQQLVRFEADLHAFLNERGVDDDEFARRYFAAGPAHHRITFMEEPPLPARCLPPDYPLERLLSYPEPSPKRLRAVVDYFRRINQEPRS